MGTRFALAIGLAAQQNRETLGGPYDGSVMKTSRGNRILLNSYFIVVFVGIGGLQMYHVNAGVLTNYGADLLAPPYLYIMFRQGRLRMSPLVAFSTVLGGCTLWELAQRYDFVGTPLAITRGTFDVLDLIAYAVGLLACYIVDVSWFATGTRPQKQGAA